MGQLLETINQFSKENQDKRIAMFVDMDGVIVNLEVDIHHTIASNKPNVFLHKRPLKSVIAMLEEVSKIPNIDLYILSACGYRNQAEDKSRWLANYAPFFKVENQLFVINEVVAYTKETKSSIKVNNIKEILETRGYDLAIYFEDEYQMLRSAHKVLKDKVLCLHISNFIV